MKQTVIYGGDLKGEMSNYLILRESMGRSIYQDRYILASLDSYLQEKGCHGKELTSEEIDGWLRTLENTMNVNTEIVYISHYTQFAKYLISLGLNAFIPDRPVRDRSYVPYVFTKDKTNELIFAADAIFSAISPYARRNAACFSVIIRLLAGCGFRLNEVLLLKTTDVDLNEAVIHVRNAKGNKDRLVPIHESLANILRIYSASGIPQKSGLYIPDRRGNPFSHATVTTYFKRCLEHAGIAKHDLPRYARNICIHCIRHSFAVASFRKLDSEGKDMYNEVPILSTYMGHAQIYGTEKYLHMTTENSSDIMDKMEIFNNGLFPEVPE